MEHYGGAWISSNNFDIEQAVYQSEKVAQCEVAGIESGEGYDIPVAHIIRESTYMGTDAELVHEIQELCQKELESDSVPQGYKICTEFPVKASGKRDMEKMRSEIQDAVF